MSSHEGTPPKSAERIRATLKSVHGEVGPGPAAGPSREGMQAHDRLVIASFHNHDVGRAFQNRLLEAGIVSSAAFERDGAKVAVDLADRERATELLALHRAECPDIWLAGPRRSIDCALLGGVLGATAGVILMVADFRGVQDLVTLGVFGLFGGMTGHVADRIRGRFRRTGRLQIGIGDLMALVALPALAVFLWKMVPAWIAR